MMAGDPEFRTILKEMMAEDTEFRTILNWTLTTVFPQFREIGMDYNFTLKPPITQESIGCL